MPAVERTKYMNEEEVTRLRENAELWSIHDLKHGRRQGVISWMLVDLALITGLRVNELARLNVSDFHHSTNSILAYRSKRKKPGYETVVIGKKVTAHLREFIAWKKAHGEGVGQTDALFVGQRGRLSVSGLQKIWKTAIAKAGLDPGLSIHSARHTCATFMLRTTKNIKHVQDHLGHQSVETTANMYAGVMHEDKEAAADSCYERRSA